MKKRLDQIIVDRGLAESKTKAQALIMAGQVTVDGTIFDKSGKLFPEDINISVQELFPYVSRGALKLEKAFHEFSLDFEGKTVCDIGSSTGGFTDFALQQGAAKVFAIDVGTGQLAQKIREDKRVVVMERTDFRDVKLPEPVDMFVCDVSFISLKKIIPKIASLLSSPTSQIKYKSVDRGSFPVGQDSRLRGNDGGVCCAGGNVDIILLIKPQFEAGAKEVSRGKGVIKDSDLRLAIVQDIKDFAVTEGFQIIGLTESPITGAKGNVEYLLCLASPSHSKI